MKTYKLVLKSTKNASVYTYEFPTVRHYDTAISYIQRYEGILDSTDNVYQFSTEFYFANCNAAIAALYAKQIEF